MSNLRLGLGYCIAVLVLQLGAWSCIATGHCDAEHCASRSKNISTALGLARYSSLGAQSTCVKQAESQFRALSFLVSLGRRREALLGAHNGGELGKSDKLEVRAMVGEVEASAASVNDREGLLFMFARSCGDYSYLLGGIGSRDEAYAAGFDYAFWEACNRISRFHGPSAHGLLIGLRKGLSDVWSDDEMDALIAIQAGASPKEAQQIRQRHI
jgi:hypothetical protein